ncbi:2'-5' RNA ligase [Tumidithrix helvetica PCC 7403]|uniref:2'-5' RNA ligase family protein n=1 Tax=Tumidithrix helvetica TaxID=3457545 RepID=UPI003CBBF1D2
MSDVPKSEASKQRFFIALLLPEPIEAGIDRIRQDFRDRFQSRAALNSPPHITLQPPFEFPLDGSTEDVSTLTKHLEEFASSRYSVPITLSGFSAFAPSVIYVAVKSPELLTMQTALAKHLETTMNLVDLQAKTRAFVPHVTVASRDLGEQNFKLAWAEFEHKSIRYDFISDRITLLGYEEQKSIAHADFPFITALQNDKSARE